MNKFGARPFATSFPGSLFSASIVVEKSLFSTTMEAEKRDPGNEVGPFVSCMFFLKSVFVVYNVIRLFSRCSRFLDPALDSIFHYLYHDHCLS